MSFLRVSVVYLLKGFKTKKESYEIFFVGEWPTGGSRS